MLTKHWKCTQDLLGVEPTWYWRGERLSLPRCIFLLCAPAAGESSLLLTQVKLTSRVTLCFLPVAAMLYHHCVTHKRCAGVLFKKARLTCCRTDGISQQPDVNTRRQIWGECVTASSWSQQQPAPVGVCIAFTLKHQRLQAGWLPP